MHIMRRFSAFPLSDALFTAASNCDSDVAANRCYGSGTVAICRQSCAPLVIRNELADSLNSLLFPMTPALYLLSGVAVGGIIAVIAFFATRRNRNADEILLTKVTLLESAQERGERMLREEMSRGREENATAAKTQREELGK